MVDVWRVETVNGQGIYTAGIGDHLDYDHGCAFGKEQPHRPMPRNDQRLMQSEKDHGSFTVENWVFGFESQRQYKNWFESANLHRAMATYTNIRIVLSQYSVLKSAVCFGDYQVRFNRSESILIACYWPDRV